MKIRECVKATLPAWMTVMVSVAGVLLWMLAACDFHDDHCYRNKVSIMSDDFGENFMSFGGFYNPPITDASDVAESVVNHYRIFNARLADKLLILSNLFPTWVTDTLHAAAYALMLLMLLRLVRRDWARHPLLTSVVVALSWIMLPWWRLGASNAYFFNYVWSAAFNLFFIERFLTAYHSENHRQQWCLPLLAFAAAMMHEGFAAPVSAALLLLTIKDLRSRTLKRHLLPAIICYWIGTVAFMLCPGLWYRIANPWEMARMKDWIYNYTIGAWPQWVLLCTMLVFAQRRGLEWLKKWSADNLLPLVIVVVSLLLSLKTYTFARAWWLSYTFCIILTLSLLISTRRIAGIMLRTGVARVMSSLSITIAVGVFLGGVVWWQQVMSNESREAFKKIERGDSNCFFIDLHQRENLPWFTLHIPMDVVGDYYLWMQVVRKTGLHPVVLPARYEGGALTDMPKVAGDNPFHGSFPWLYSPCRLAETDRLYLVKFDHPICWEQESSYSIFFLARQWWQQQHGQSRDLEHAYMLKEYPVVNKNNYGNCTSPDTLWFYSFREVYPAMKWCRITRMDIIH